MVFKLFMPLIVATVFAQVDKESMPNSSEVTKEAKSFAEGVKKKLKNCVSESNNDKNEPYIIQLDDKDKTVTFEEKLPPKKIKKFPMKDLSSCETLQAQGKKIRCTEDEKKTLENAISRMKSKKSCKKLARDVDAKKLNDLQDGESNSEYKEITIAIIEKVKNDQAPSEGTHHPPVQSEK